LEQAVQGHIDMQYGAMLQPVIAMTIEQHLQRSSHRSARVALHAYAAAEQARILIIRLLSILLPDIDELPELIAHSQQQARENMQRSLGDEEVENTALWQS